MSYSSVGPAVAEVRRAVHRGAAEVDRHRAGVAQRQLADLPRGGVVQAEHDAQRYVRPSAVPRIAPLVSWTDARDPGETDAGRHRGALVRALGGRRRLPLRPHRRARRRLLRSTRRRRPCPARSTWAPCSATPRPTPSPATSGWPARRSSTRSAGTTTAWPPSAGCRTSTACAATRRSPTTPASRRRTAATSRRTTARCRSRGPTSSSCATS